eukprot:Tbor_TRINITY_DN5941_c1_g3::TRINITY_DN5941_c1_g3_i1::g.18940::m.18940
MSMRNMSTVQLGGPTSLFDSQSTQRTRDNVGTSVPLHSSVKKGEFSPQASSPSCAFNNDANSMYKSGGRKKIHTHDNLGCALLPQTELSKKPGSETHPHLYKNMKGGSTLNHVIVGDCDIAQPLEPVGGRRHVCNLTGQSTWDGMSAPEDTSKISFRKHVETPYNESNVNIISGQEIGGGGRSQLRTGRKTNYCTSATISTIDHVEHSVEHTPAKRMVCSGVSDKKTLVGVFKPDDNFFEKREYTFQPLWNCETDTGV